MHLVHFNAESSKASHASLIIALGAPRKPEVAALKVKAPEAEVYEAIFISRPKTPF